MGIRHEHPALAAIRAIYDGHLNKRQELIAPILSGDRRDSANA